MRITFVIVIALLSILLGGIAMADNNTAIEGSWSGPLQVPNAHLTIVFNISRSPQGNLTATMDSPDQGAKGIPIDSALFTNNHLHLIMVAIKGSYEGDLKPDGTIAGTWTQGGSGFPLVLSRSDQKAAEPSIPPAAAPAPAKGNGPIDGSWLGTLEFSGNKLRVVYTFSTDSAGKFTARMASPDQGVKNIPIDEATFVNNHLHIAVKALIGTYEGDYDPAKSVINGQWTQSGNTLPLILARTEGLAKPNRPQEPKPPFPYDQRDVTYENKAAGLTLAGTLTYPRTGTPSPAVIMITGSGLQNRDEEIFDHKPFWVMADYLTRRGIAVLRVDDRSVGGSTGSAKNATSLDFVGDVMASLAFLKTQKEVDPKQIGLIGHSEGGMIGPMVAVKDPTIKFVVVMAGPGETGKKILLAQTALHLKGMKAPEDDIAKALKLNEETYDIVLTEPDSAKAADKIRALSLKEVDSATMADTAQASAIRAATEVSVKQIMSPWFRYFLAFDPVPTLRQLKCPVLAINGSLDKQVSPKENLAGIEAALKAGGNKDFLVKELPGLNHLFQTAPTGTPLEYATIEETISPMALSTMGDWIVAHVTLKK